MNIPSSPDSPAQPSSPIVFHEAERAESRQGSGGHHDRQLALILEEIGSPFYTLDRHWRFTSVNRAAETYYGVPRDTMMGRIIWDLFPASVPTLRPVCEKVLTTGEPILFEGDSSRAKAALALKIFPCRDGIGISLAEWSAQRRAEEVLKESQAQLSALADNLPLGVVYQMNDGLSYEDRRFLYISASCERLNGVPASHALQNPHFLFDLILPEHREHVARKLAEAHRNRTPFDVEFEIRHARTGEIRWQRIVDAPRQLPNGSYVWDGIQIDITDHKRAEEHLRLLVNELNHRVKNTLATVQSLAAQSFARIGRSSDDAFLQAREAFEARLFALARGHDILTRENWEGVRLSDVVAEIFAPYQNMSGNGDAITSEGPDLRVTPTIALSLSMALHELCTNALKYGALKQAGGTVRITWEVSGSGDARRLLMRWEERGGPVVSAPSQRGFGSRLIEDGLSRELNGTVHLGFEPTGVVCAIDVPLSSAG
ncbi:sensor histidine kinase [Microvirga puerhi]|uniref:Blue-light-activated histidine kinase n=1 Tax=Microvirga puerhi TaxID=2876078 RepID=A0ABS7VMD0_9HYPH|nr:HWE histidine kinase domain-containing protein [Microvirga puerhi]MBZ6076389.1 PAS domain-containing protein [Microvirga puerhi]